MWFYMTNVLDITAYWNLLQQRHDFPFEISTFYERFMNRDTPKL